MSRDAAVRCGCAGKTPLDRVVLPARERIRDRLDDTSVGLGPDRDAAVFPRRERLESSTETVELDTDPATAFDADDSTWTLACAFAGDRLSDPSRFAATIGDAYATLDGSPVTVGKGHAVQVPGSDVGALWLEHLRPVGPRRDGVIGANVDAIHGFPGLPPAVSLEIAVLNACNDLYTVGAITERQVRPIVAAPRGDAPSRDAVASWATEAIQDTPTVLQPVVLEHDGEGRLFGASVRAVAPRAPPRPTLDDDMGVLLTRPLGALALYAHGVATGDERLRERGRSRLRRDSHTVATALTRFRPDPSESFDPDRHLARITDVSGEGVAGIGSLVADAGKSLLVEKLPLLPGVDSAADAWTVPDVSVETNGPFAVIARQRVLGSVAERLASVGGAEPVRLGAVQADGPQLMVAPDCDAARYVERAALWDDSSGGESYTEMEDSA